MGVTCIWLLRRVAHSAMHGPSLHKLHSLLLLNRGRLDKPATSMFLRNLFISTKLCSFAEVVGLSLLE
ncbi:hypothetical protein [Diadegma fenestrale ichnovirus]|nr:hypothetical protein [Diadegma fenestrale ichnovirus]